jgi:integrase
MSTWAIDADTALEELWARWTTETASERDPQTSELYLTTYGATHIAPFFKTLGAITLARVSDYTRKRLAVVKKETVQKELSALRGFAAWCEEQGYVDTAPVIPKPPRRARGTPFAKRRRGKPTPISVDQARSVISCLPEWSESRRVPRFPIRGYFVVLFETTLRPGTLARLCIPEHYTRGARILKITDQIDKARFGRELPLTPEARATLDAVLPKAGLIFGDHDYRDQLRKAAEAILPKELARTFTAYDLRHARITQLAAEGDLPAVAYLAGHRQVTTTNRYVHGSRQAAERLLAGAGPTGFAAPTLNPVSSGSRLARVGNPVNRINLCEGEDSNLHGSYPASTSS